MVDNSLNPAITKRCSRCLDDRPRGEFYRRKDGALVSACKTCCRVRALAYYAENLDACRARMDAQKERNPTRHLEWQRANGEHLKRKARARYAENGAEIRRRAWLKSIERRFGLSEADVATLLAAQNGACAACGAGFVTGDAKLRPCMDHCHASGRHRGFLCHSCNVTLGHVSDDPGRLDALAAYLRRPVPPRA